MNSATGTPVACPQKPVLALYRYKLRSDISTALSDLAGCISPSILPQVYDAHHMRY